jgi:hypothetical protein
MTCKYWNSENDGATVRVWDAPEHGISLVLLVVLLKVNQKRNVKRALMFFFLKNSMEMEYVG